MTPLVVHVFDLWLSFHSLHYTDVSPIKMTMTLCCKTILKTLSSQFHVFHEGFLRFLHNINLPNRPFNKCDYEIFLSEKEHHVVQEDAWTFMSFFLLQHLVTLLLHWPPNCLYMPCLPPLISLWQLYILIFFNCFCCWCYEKRIDVHTYMYLVSSV